MDNVQLKKIIVVNLYVACVGELILLSAQRENQEEFKKIIEWVKNFLNSLTSAEKEMFSSSLKKIIDNYEKSTKIKINIDIINGIFPVNKY